LDEIVKIKIEHEISRIQKSLDAIKPLFDLCKLKEPDIIEVVTAGKKVVTAGKKVVTAGKKVVTTVVKVVTDMEKVTTAGVEVVTAGVKVVTAGKKVTTAGKKVITNKAFLPKTEKYCRKKGCLVVLSGGFF
jgi:homoserine dehydrogenase